MTLAATVSRLRRATEVAALTLSGAEQMDLAGISRITGVEGDGLAVGSGTGVWEATTPKNTVAFPGATAATSLSTFGTMTLTKETPDADAPFQGQEMWKIVAGDASASGINFDGAVGNTNKHSMSVWARVDAGTAQLATNNNEEIVSITSTSWTRVVSANFTPAASARLMRVQWPAGNNGNTIHFQGGQLEEQPIATPVSANSAGATQARSAARVRANIADIGWDGDQSWFVARMRMGWASAAPPGGANRVFHWSDGSPNIDLMIHMNNASPTAIELFRSNNDGGVSEIDTLAISEGDFVTIIGAWTTAELRLSINGGAFTTQANTSSPSFSATTIEIGRRNSANNWIDSNFLWVAFGAGTLTDADAAWFHRVGVGGGVPDLYEAPGDCRAIWDGRNAEFVRRPVGVV